MTAPTIDSVTPDSGSSLGQTFVTIDGEDFNLVAQGTVKVKFGGIEATEVMVISATQILCLTPRPVAVGVVDLEVINLTNDDPDPPIEESETLEDAFTYKRPDISTQDDHEFDSAIALVTRALVAEMRLCVMENIHTITNLDYIDLPGATTKQEKQMVLPGIELIGPEVRTDRFHSENGEFTVETSPGIFDTFAQNDAKSLTYTYKIRARTGTEASNILSAIVRYLDSTPVLVVPRDGVDVANGSISLDMGPSWDQVGSFFDGAIRQEEVVREGLITIFGVPSSTFKIREGRAVEDIIVDYVPIPPDLSDD